MSEERGLDIAVVDEFSGARIDKWLAAAADGLSRTRAQSLIKAGCVLDADGEVVAGADLKVAAGDTYNITIPEQKPESPPKPENIPVPVLFEDEDIIVVDKPAGMVAHRGAGVDSGTLVNALLYHTGGRLSSIGIAAARPGIVHRLDKGTSGAMVACKTDRAHMAMYKMFERHEVKRQYVALAWGIPNPPAGAIEKNIGRDMRNRTKMRVMAEGGKGAITHYETAEVFAGAKFKPISLLRLRLETGRTHQIRVHMASIGNPVLGDAAYGNAGRQLNAVENKEVKAFLSRVGRQMLHSRTIEFSHPITGKKIKLEAPVPEDMEAAMEFLRNA